MKRIGIIFLICSLLMAGCKQKDLSPKSDQQITKENVASYLKSQDGKDLLVDILTDKDVKEDLFIHAKTTKDVITDIANSDKQRKMWEELFKDHDFQDAFASSMEEEHKKLLEKLLKDPNFQGTLINILNDPEVTDQVIQALKSRKFRSHLSDVIIETIETPRTSKEIKDSLEEKPDKKKEKKDKKKDEKKEKSGQDKSNQESG